MSNFAVARSPPAPQITTINFLSQRHEELHNENHSSLNFIDLISPEHLNVSHLGTIQ